MDKKTAIAGLLIVMLIIGSSLISADDSCGGKCDIDVGKEIDNEWYPKEGFCLDETVGIRCQTFPTNNDITIYIFTNRGWTSGQPIPEDDTANSGSIQTDGSGETLWTWDASSVGLYDILVDVDQNGVYNRYTDAVLSRSPNVIAFEVVPEMSTMTLMGAGLLSIIGFIGVRRIR